MQTRLGGEFWAGDVIMHKALLDNLICIMNVLCSQKHEKFNIAVEKEDKKHKVFLYLYAD